MDRQERARLRALCDKATAGEWFGESSTDAYYRLTAISPDRGHSDLLAEFHHPQKFVDGKRVVDDARKAEVIWNLAFSSEARTALPSALDALDAAEARAEQRGVDLCQAISSRDKRIAELEAARDEQWTFRCAAEHQRDAAEARITELEAKRLDVHCAFCGEHMVNISEETANLRMAEHIVTCEKHPLRAAVNRVQELEAERRATVEAIVRRLREDAKDTHPTKIPHIWSMEGAARLIEREFLEKGGA